ncbi:relaxase/mobilization nuclease domain-containing protein [Puia dinghuensis]|uniref:Mobilization protein n=1 Tax=Puia dinghuensis TaxID=1792502 RepID=A0A8J2UF43_9BACT|nr:relaxase/mobilization nuclease domain-containing protein [Puia dinghuensis]GGB09013.1 mobilization protein [Puia dinghuensis]
MQPQIKPNNGIYFSLHYNEQKIDEGKAERIGAENFLKDHDQLTEEEILDRFRQRSSFNERLHDYGVHFSLNFGKEEKLDNKRLVEVANRYMTGMGFEDQPYVVYRHLDAGHTHVHIVATTVRADGRLKKLEPKDYHASHRLCRELEREFSLEKNLKATAEDQLRFAVDHAQKITYGEQGLTHAISDVLNTVVDHYNYTSLDEFNAILKQYNVTANPGLEDSRLRKLGGLLYHALDENGNRIGKPIKASAFLLKPTIKKLEKKFAENLRNREAPRERLHTAIEWAVAGETPDWARFKENLEREGIDVVTAKRADGEERVFFVDHVGKYAFGGESLGAGYDLAALRKRLAPEQQLEEQQSQEHQINLHL